jgi:hypothetical protein
MTDIDLDIIRNILRNMTVSEAFDICERHALNITITGTDKERVESITIETVRYLRDFIKT